MGLSNEERIHKIFYAVRRIVELGKKFEDDGWYEDSNPYLSLKKLSADLWPAMFQKSSNGGFWLLGNDEEVSFDKCTPWSIPLYNCIKFAGKKEIFSSARENDFDPFDGYLDIHGLLVQSPNKQHVYRMYEWIQQYQYAVNRYTDELSASFSEVSRIAGSMMGEIFCAFEEGKEDFSAVYLLHEISKILYGNVKKMDCVSKLLIDNNIHHEIPNYKKRDSERVFALKRILKSLRDDNSLRNRLLRAIEVGGQSFAQYPHKEKELIKVAKEVNLSFGLHLKPMLKKIEKDRVADSKCHSDEYSETRKFYRDDLLS